MDQSLVVRPVCQSRPVSDQSFNRRFYSKLHQSWVDLYGIDYAVVYRFFLHNIFVPSFFVHNFSLSSWLIKNARSNDKFVRIFKGPNDINFICLKVVEPFDVSLQSSVINSLLGLVLRTLVNHGGPRMTANDLGLPCLTAVENGLSTASNLTQVIPIEHEWNLIAASMRWPGIWITIILYLKLTLYI